MSTLLFKNNASTTLSGSINNSQTTVTVASSATFPTISGGDYFYATMYEVSGNPSVEINIEIVKVTGVSGNQWTIVRGQDGTTARSRDGISTCYVENRLTAASAALMAQKDRNLADLASASTARTNLGLGSIATQDASSVNITGGTITGVTINSIDSTTNIIDNADNTKKLAFEVSGVATGTTRTLTVPNASGTIALTSDLTSGYQPLDSDLTALAALSSTGLVSRTGSGTVSARTLTAPAAGITVSNGDGVSGNPTLALANDLAAVEAMSTTGFVKRTAADTWTAGAIANADVPTALSGKTYDGLTLTANATGFTVAGGTTSKAVQFNNSMTIAGTDGTTITLPATSGTVPLNNQTFFVGTTQIAINRTSATQSLTGVSIDGSAGSASTATSATTATNVASGVLGSLPYQSAASTTALLSPNTSTTRNFLRMTGTGSAGAAPAWDTITKTDVGLANVENTALSTWAGSANLTTVGTVASGTWNATTIGISKGGTGQTTAVAAFDALSPATTLGDLIYHDGTDNVRLAGNTVAGRRFLRQTGNGSVSAAPSWDSLLDADLPSALTGKTYNALTLTAAATGFTIAGGTTSKTLTVNNTLALSGTDSSTLNIGSGGTLGSAAYTSSTSYAPAAGSSSIVTVGTITSGTWTGSTLGISYGGTGATSKAAAFNALSPTTSFGDLIYSNGTDNVRLSGNTTTTKQFLTSTGNGSSSTALAWGSIANGDIPSTLTDKTYNGLGLTANATGFSVAGGTTSKSLTIKNNLTFSGSDGAELNIGSGGTIGTAAYTASTAYQPADADLSAIAALSGTSGLLRKTAADTWSLDTTSYLTGNQSITLSGDASGSGSTAISVTLANSGVSAGTYPKVTVDAKGRVTAGASLASGDVTGALGYTPQAQDADLTAIAALAGTSGFLKKTAADTWALDTNTYLTGNQTVTLSGDATGSGSTSIAVTLANSGVTAGTYTKLTVDAKGRVTSGTTLASADLPTYTGTITSSQVTTALGYTPYNSTNPSGYTSNTGTVTSVSGTGTVSGLTLSGTVTSSGSLTLGGAITGFLPSTGGALTGVLEINSEAAAPSGGSHLTLGRATGYKYIQTWSSEPLNLNPLGNAVQITGNAALHAGNYNSYAPTLTGTGASGTWGINVTGSAGSVAWANVSSKPTTLSGYGITDALAISGGSLTGDLGTTYKIGVGTASPSYTLHVVGTGSSTARAVIESTGTGNSAPGALQFLRGSTSTRALSAVGQISFTDTATDSTNFASVINATGNNSTKTQDLYYNAVTGHIWQSSGVELGRLTTAGLKLTGASRRIIGDFDNGTLGSRTLFQGATTNSTTGVGAIPNGTSQQADFTVFNSSDPANSAYASLLISATKAQIVSSAVGTGTTNTLFFTMGGTDRASLDTSGNFIAAGNVTAYGTPSDRRLKENIEPLTGALASVEALNGYRYNYIGKTDKLLGVIAQEVEAVAPELIYEFTDLRDQQWKAVRYEHMTALLIEAVKELSTRVKALEAR